MHPARRQPNPKQENQRPRRKQPSKRKGPTRKLSADPQPAKAQRSAFDRHAGAARPAAAGVHRLSGFYVDVAGLTLEGKDRNEARFGGSAGRHDLRLVAVPQGSKTGLLDFSFAVPAGSDLIAAGKALAAKGIAAEASSLQNGPALVVTDPDGFRIAFRQVH